MINPITIGSVIAVSGIAYAAWHLYNQNTKLQEQLKIKNSEYKSLAIKHGQTVEHILPCSKYFPEGKFFS